MKLFPIAAAALAMLAGLAPVAPAAAAPAPAPQRHVEERTVVTHRTVVRHDDRRYRPRWRTKRVCRVERHRGERTRICRTVRYRR
ncbi:hypothetical protein [Sphingomonas sp.]|uniref:hypothetical protein n=1 Tax=Sphingomonas sp. TaxID=28214 RepID=UPI0035BBFA38